MKIVDARTLTDSELVARKKEARQEQFNLRLQQQTGALEKPSRLKELKRQIARVETVASQRRLGIKVEAKAAAPAPKAAKKAKAS